VCLSDGVYVTVRQDKSKDKSAVFCSCFAERGRAMKDLPRLFTWLPISAAVLAALAVPVNAQVANSRICVSVFRYGGAASGWVRDGAGGVHPAGAFNSITTHINRANQVFIQAGIEWVWADGAIEDLRDPFGAGNGDIEGVFTEDEPLSKRERQDARAASRDVAQILQDTADSECFPIVFVNGMAGVFGWAVLDAIRLPIGEVRLGVVALIDSDAFPQPENIFTLIQKESLISTLAHELAHSLCLDPSAPAPPAFVAWGDATGHPPRPPAPATPEGASRFEIFPPGRVLRTHVTWFTGVERSGDELLSPRQIALAQFCEPALRARYSPSFSVAPGGPSGLPHNQILWAPSVGVPPPVNFGLLAGEGLDALSYGKDFGPGRFQYKFSVDSMTLGLAGTAVNQEASKVPPEAHGDEFAAPWGGPAVGDPPAIINIHILDEGQFGLVPSDNVDSLVQDAPAEPLAPVFLFGPVDVNRDGVLDIDARVFFSVAPGGALDPADVLVATGLPDGVNIAVYASRAALGLVAGDDIDALCVSDDGNGVFQPGVDKIHFSLTRTSPSVAGALDSSDVLAPGPVVVTPAAALGLRGNDADELNALKCYAVVHLAINMNDNPDPVKVGSNLTYTIRVANTGSAPATGVKVTDTLPRGVNFVSASSGCSTQGRTITCTIPSLAPDEKATLQITVQPTVPGGLRNTVSVTANEHPRREDIARTRVIP
jgi:uncharacterized repeat protein (TIGR01451 family)